MKESINWYWTPELKIVRNLAQQNGISQVCECSDVAYLEAEKEILETKRQEWVEGANIATNTIKKVYFQELLKEVDYQLEYVEQRLSELREPTDLLLVDNQIENKSGDLDRNSPPESSESLSATFSEKSPPEINGGNDEIIHLDPNGENSEIIHLDLEEVRRDGGTQPRTKIDLLHIKRLEEQMEDGQEIEPVVVFYDGESYWLADGFHRWNAHRNQEEPTIRAIVHQGSRREAVLYSVGANADHKPALPRSRADKRRAVLTLLNDPQWKQWSDRAIAKMCKVHHQMVGRLRTSLDDHPVTKSSTDTLITTKSSSNKTSQSLTGESSSDPTDQSLTGESSSDDTRTYRTKHGTIATMNTANIGKTQEEEEDADTTIKVTTDEILIAFSSNLENFSDEQLQFIGRAIANLPPERLRLIVDQ
ncbi:MAG: ParB N-terminal domain-containing protein [Crocosphaera sp.]